MQEVLLNILYILVTTVIIPLITTIGVRTINKINGEIKNSRDAKTWSSDVCSSDLTLIVTNAVKMVFQTYVESLKASGTFTPESQKEALQKAKTIALSQIKTDTQMFIQENFGDFDKWLENQVEATIYKLKNN